MVGRLAITLLRHGITTDNQEKRYIGWSDSPLSESGRKSLLEQSQRYTFADPDTIISSDLKRCHETYDILYGSKPNIPILYSKLWRECSFGCWERQTHDELANNSIYKEWLYNWETASIPNGEDFTTFKTRILQGWDGVISLLLRENINHVAVITHGGPIRTILSMYAPVNKPFWEWNVSNGEGFYLETTVDRLRRNERCISLQEVPFKESVNG
jgi:alpha-ribazole phosphatase